MLLLEAAISLAIASLAIAMLPFRCIERLAAIPIRSQEASNQQRREIVPSVRWAILRTAARVPWRARCFEQGLAAQLMLRRRGIPSVLYYGATQDARNGLHAHVWVQDGDVDVVGGESAHRFTVLARFPASDVGKPFKSVGAYSDDASQF